MLRFVVRRLASMVFVLFSISVLSFLIFFATPGVDPAARIAGRNADQATLRAVRKDFGLDRPLPVQYALMMKKLFISRDLTSFVNRGAKVIPQVTEAALSFLSIGVQQPNASWGSIILDGQGLLYTRPAVALAPGIAIAVTVLALNVLGDGIRDALDPRAKLRRIN